ncbi:MAG: hypothetical protein V8S96_06610 [Lachnospiraceae bacterium]
MRLRGAIFDFNGTLFDTMSVWDTAGEDYLRLIGMTPGETINEELKTMSLQQAAEAVKEQYRIPKSTETIIDEVNEMVGDFYLYRAEPKPEWKNFWNNWIKMEFPCALPRRRNGGWWREH